MAKASKAPTAGPGDAPGAPAVDGPAAEAEATRAEPIDAADDDTSADPRPSVDEAADDRAATTDDVVADLAASEATIRLDEARPPEPAHRRARGLAPRALLGQRRGEEPVRPSEG